MGKKQKHGNLDPGCEASRPGIPALSLRKGLEKDYERDAEGDVFNEPEDSHGPRAAEESGDEGAHHPAEDHREEVNPGAGKRVLGSSLQSHDGSPFLFLDACLVSESSFFILQPLDRFHDHVGDGPALPRFRRFVTARMPDGDVIALDLLLLEDFSRVLRREI